MKTLLIVFHTKAVKTALMADAVERGARQALKEAEAEGELAIVVKRCADAGPEDVLAADGILLGCAEHFGYMSGMMKDFLERIFYPLEGKTEGRPWALFVSSGLDGTGARTSVERIVTGLRWKKIAEPLVALRELTPEHIAKLEELGATMAAGLVAGVF